MSRLYALFGRISYILTLPLSRLVFGRPSHRRVRVLVMSPDRRQVLLQKSWFSPQLWSMPGGGIAWGESDIEAVIREVREETGVILRPEEVSPLGTFRHAPGVPFTVVAFLAVVPFSEAGPKGIRKLEILEAKWFSLSELPVPLSRTAQVILQSAHILAKPQA